MSGWLIDLLILLAILAIVAVAAWYILGQVNLPEPIRKIVLIALVALVAIVACIMLLNLRSGVRVGKVSDFPPIGAQIPPASSIITTDGKR